MAILAVYTAPMAYSLDDIDDLSVSTSFVKVSNGLMNAVGEVTDPIENDEFHLQNCVMQDKAAAEQEAYNNSWNKFTKDNVIAGARFAVGKAWDISSYAARTALAWNMNYYGINLIEEATAYTAYGLGALAGGPAAGTGAYYATKGALKVARFVIPGFEGYLAGVCAPVTKALIVDPVINYGPSVVKGVANAGIAGTKAVANGLGSLYSYYWRA